MRYVPNKNCCDFLRAQLQALVRFILSLFDQRGVRIKLFIKKGMIVNPALV